MKKKTIKAWAVIDTDSVVSDGTEQIAIFWTKKPAQKWHKEMFMKGEGRVVPCIITYQSK